MTQGQPDLGEQALSKIAAMGLSSQLDEVETLDVDIRTNPLKLVQGEVDSVTIEGTGLVMQHDLRMETVKVKTGTVSINPLSSVLGKIELTQSATANAHIVLTEEDLNRALNSDYLRDKMEGLEVQVNGERLTIDTQQAQLLLPGNNRIALSTEVLIRETGERQHIAVTAIPRVREQGQRISLEDIEFADEQGTSSALATALFETVMELLDVRNFELQGMSFQFNKLDVQQGRLVFQATAHVDQFPSV